MSLADAPAGVWSKLRVGIIASQNCVLMPWSWRRRILASVGMRIGDRSFIEPTASMYSGRVEVGDDTYINNAFMIDGMGRVRIGARVRIGPCVKLLTATHDVTDDPLARASEAVRHLPIAIEDGAWIGAGATVMGGCTVRTGCVVGANALVTRDTEPNGLYVGTPARRARDLPAARVDRPARPAGSETPGERPEQQSPTS